jgi:hypothetical protein
MELVFEPGCYMNIGRTFVQLTVQVFFCSKFGRECRSLSGYDRREDWRVG